MARTDENGRNLQAVLSYMLNRAVPAKEIYDALGIARNTWHNRSEDDSFPNAEECRLIAGAFDLNPLDLWARFGLVSDEQIESFVGGPVVTHTTTAAPRRRLPKISELPGNPHLKSL